MADTKDNKRGKTKVAKRLAFVIMPYEKALPSKKKLKYPQIGREELDEIFGMIKRALQRRGYDVKREVSAGDIVRGIIFDLDQADLVVADLTGLNPNVMYELGIRHTFTKKTIILTQDRSELPFDLKNHHAIEYGWKTDPKKREFRKHLKQTLTEIESGKDVRFGPVHVHLGARSLGVLEYEKERIRKRLLALVMDLGMYFHRCTEYTDTLAIDGAKVLELDIEKGVEHSLSDSQKEKVAGLLSSYLLTLPESLPALDLLLSEYYLPDNLDDYDDMTSFVDVARSFRMTLQSLKEQMSINDLLAFFEKIYMLVQDAIAITGALDKDLVHMDLCLRTKHFRNHALRRET